MTNDDPRINLLTDLLKLLKKHGELSFRQLAETLRDPEIAAAMTTLLEETPKRVPARKAPKTKEKKSEQQRHEPSTTSLQQWSDIILDKKNNNQKG
jgi:hypothetical protein